jgi:AraC family transcriptional regulator, transcriptional activator of pobA
MTKRSAIAYVEIAASPTVEQLSSFYYRRILGLQLPGRVADVPHRHNYQEILIVESGSGRHLIDGQQVLLGPGTVSVISKGQVHLLDQASDLYGWVVRFTDDFLPAGLISQSWNYQATLFNPLARSHTATMSAADLRDIRNLLLLLEAEYGERVAFQQESALRHLLSLLIISLERIYQTARYRLPQARDAYRRSQEFLALLEQSFARHHDVGYYAAALGLSPTRLSRMLARILGKTTKQLIDDRIVIEAKRYLSYTDQPLLAIARNLGYGDQFHFSKTFKRLTGLAPQAYREESQKMT